MPDDLEEYAVDYQERKLRAKKKRKESREKGFYKFHDWRRSRVLGSGGFGLVYLVTNNKDKRVAALKAEPADVDPDEGIRLEGEILRRLNDKGPVPHIPELIETGTRKRYWCLVMTLLGPNLKQLKKKSMLRDNGGFTAGTWSRLGIQCLYALKFVHDNGFVHREIKPQNFLLGAPEDKERARIVHVLDFGLARKYVRFSKRRKRWEGVRVEGSPQVRTNLRFSSLNVHEKKEQGRVDDMWSLIYMLVDFNGWPKLPWQRVYDREVVEEVKRKCSAEIVMAHMPSCMLKVMKAIEKLDCYQRPDYHLFFKALWKVMTNDNATPASKYDWEEEEPSGKEHVSGAKWEDSNGAFFLTDPIGTFVVPGRPEAMTLEVKTSNKSDGPSMGSGESVDAAEEVKQ